jgi:hypothetical protein
MDDARIDSPISTELPVLVVGGGQAFVDSSQRVELMVLTQVIVVLPSRLD